MCIITFSRFTIVAKQGGHVGPLGVATYTLASLNYISTPTIVSIVGMCVNNYKLAKYISP
jgi:hypothetical protein